MRGGKLGFVIYVWVMFMCGSCLCGFVVEKNCLKVTSPENLKDTYECAIGNFGVPQYGGTLSGFVVYPKANQKACASFADDISFKNKPRGALPVVLLADRGDCCFTLKALNAQNAGAAAILIADDIADPLITMDFPEEEGAPIDYLQNITIPSALITRSLGDSIKKALNKGDLVHINLDWREALPHPDARVEYELWTNSNDGCGPKCDGQLDFVKSFKGAAQMLERKGYTQFTPHYITWYCPEPYTLSKKCKSQCINYGRYCAPDPEQDFSKGYDGKDVILQTLLQACFYKVANESGTPWIWWDYMTDFAIRCSMKEKKYTKDCADEVIKSLGADLKKVDECVGDVHADTENAVLEAEHEAQIRKGGRGDVTFLPTLIINNRQYRGKLDKQAVLKAICSGLEATTEPALCLSNDIDECKEKTVCQCPECECKNTQGSYECSCSGSLVYVEEQDACLSKDGGWGFALAVVLGLVAIGVVGYTFYKYRVRGYMDSKIQAIMAQYMTLDDQQDVAIHGSQRDREQRQAA